MLLLINTITVAIIVIVITKLKHTGKKRLTGEFTDVES